MTSRLFLEHVKSHQDDDEDFDKLPFSALSLSSSVCLMDHGHREASEDQRCAFEMEREQGERERERERERVERDSIISIIYK